MRFRLLLALAWLMLPLSAVAQTPASRPATVDELLDQMTLEEKIGQMTQITLSAVAREGATPEDEYILDEAKLRHFIVDHYVGSMLNNVSRAYTPEQWREIVGQMQSLASDTRLGIPIVYGIDAVHGANYTLGGTLLPQNIGLAATFDPDLVRETGVVTARETRASGIPWNFSPVLDLGRQPLWPRFYETFGEDVYVTEEMGRALVEGYQGTTAATGPIPPDHVAATLKHFIGYSDPRSGKDRTTAHIPERILREYFLPPFEEAVEAGARSVMVNSGDVNGIPVHASRFLLTDVLRGELGFDGVIVTDWEDIIKLHTIHRVAPDLKEAAYMSVMAGIDMSMVPNDLSFYNDMIELVNEGRISEERIDESVRRILQMKMDLGLFEAPLGPTNLGDVLEDGSRHALNLDAARATMTLLKNEDGVLPLQRDARVLLAGPAAHSMTALNGGWTYTWQGRDSSYVQHYPESQTILQALREVAGSDNISYVPGTDFIEAIDINAAADAAQDADVVVLALGEDAYAEKPGDIDNLTLSEPQLQLAEALAATGKPVVLVLVEGRPRVVSDTEPLADAVLMAYQPGMAGGVAIAEVLYGDVNPSGRLPFTYPRQPNDLVPYDHEGSAAVSQVFGQIGRVRGFDPQWTFGHGLSYTTFEYADLQVTPESFGENDAVTVSVTVTNTGNRAGDEAVLLFAADHYASVAPAVRRLRKFDKVSLDAGQSTQVTFTLRPEELAFVGENNEWTLEPGAFTLEVGGITQEVVLTED